MIHPAASGHLYRDLSVWRLSWTLPLAVVLVVLGVVTLGQIVTRSPRPPIASKPLSAQIYELPSSRGATPSRPARFVAKPARRATPPRMPPAPRRPPLPVQKTPNMPGIARPPRRLDWSALNNQIKAAVNQETRQETLRLSVAEEVTLAHKRDPHTLVARYYIASILEKLQRIGEMNYPTNLTGTPVLKLVIGADGRLIGLKLLRSSGNPRLDRTAQRIARESAPFAPFPDKLRRQTSHIEFICYMSFVGYRQIYTN